MLCSVLSHTEQRILCRAAWGGQRGGRYSLTVERNMMVNPMNMGMWYPILEREQRGPSSGGLLIPPGKCLWAVEQLLRGRCTHKCWSGGPQCPPVTLQSPPRDTALLPSPCVHPSTAHGVCRRQRKPENNILSITDWEAVFVYSMVAGIQQHLPAPEESISEVYAGI